MAALVLAAFFLTNDYPLLLDIKPGGPWRGELADVQLTIRNRSGRTLWVALDRSLLNTEPIVYSYAVPDGGGGGYSIACGGPSLSGRVKSASAVRLEPEEELEWMTTLDHVPASQANTVWVSFNLAASPDRTAIMRLRLESVLRLIRDPRTGCAVAKGARGDPSP